MESEEDGKAAEGASSAVACSICLEPVVRRAGRSTASLQCGHEFHLDCIGSAFNAKGAMQCPNCRTVEKGQWLYANGCHSFSDFNMEELMNEEFYDLRYSDTPFGLLWCPFQGFVQLSSLFEEGEIQASSYHDIPGYRDQPNPSSSGRHVCPYLALHGSPHVVHTPSSGTGTTDTIPDASASYQRQSTGISGPRSAETVNPNGYSATEPRSHQWQQAPAPSHIFNATGGTSNGTELHLGQFSSRPPRNDPNGQQRSGSVIQPRRFIRGSISTAGTSLVASLMPPVIGNVRVHTHGHGGSHVYQQSSSSLRGGPFSPVGRSRPRALTLISSLGVHSSVDAGDLYGFSVSGSVSRTHLDGESGSRRFDHFYGWVRDGFAPLPWVPNEAESQWWSPFHPNQNPHRNVSGDSMARNYFPQGVFTERVAHGRPEGNHHWVPSVRMSPFM